jgi:uncharacterized protein YecT (DUF1311 family)
MPPFYRILFFLFCLAFSGNLRAEEPFLDFKPLDQSQQTSLGDDACQMPNTTAARILCQDSGLLALDRKITDYYRSRRQQAQDAAEQSALKQEEKSWREGRDLQCGLTTTSGYGVRSVGGKDPAACFQHIYVDRDPSDAYRRTASFRPDHTDVAVSGGAFTPHLLLSKDDKMCGDLESVVQARYFQKSTGASFQDDLLQKAKSFRGGHWIPSDEKENIFEVRRNGTIQTVYLEASYAPRSISAFSFYLKNTAFTDVDRAAFQEKEQSYQEFNDVKSSDWREVFSQTQMSYSFPFHVLWLRDDLYVFRNGETENEATTDPLPKDLLGLYKIDENDALTPVCQIVTSPTLIVGEETYVNAENIARDEAREPIFEAPPELSRLFQLLYGIEGEMPSSMNCESGSGESAAWRYFWDKRQLGRFAALVKPWLDGDVDTIPGEYALAYLRGWGLQNLSNYQAYRPIEESLPSARESLQNYYVKYFGIASEPAQQLANFSINRILATSVRINSPQSWRPERGEDQMDEAFIGTYRTTIQSQGRILSRADLQRVALLGRDDLIRETPQNLIRQEINDPGGDQADYSAPEPILIYGVESPSVLSALLEKGALVNTGNWFGKTALMYAAQQNRPESIQVLLKAKANVNQATVPVSEWVCGPEISGRTAMMYAAENGSAETIRLLIDAGADLTAQDSTGRGIKDYLALNKRLSGADREEIVTLLSKAPIKSSTQS